MKKKFFKYISLGLVLILGLAVLGVLSSSIIKPSKQINTINLTVVLDAGHGGEDGGCVGTSTGIKESDLNLIYTQKVGALLTAMGVKVVYTRTTNQALYPITSKDKKLDDMKKREEIVKKANPQAVVSIHMNKFPSKTSSGAQVFYNDKSKNGEVLAKSIKEELVKNIDNARDLHLAGDYYMVNCASAPSVIVECGFLSNPEEEILLQNEEYQDKLSYTIFLGIVKYLNIKNN